MTEREREREREREKKIVAKVKKIHHLQVRIRDTCEFVRETHPCGHSEAGVGHEESFNAGETFFDVPSKVLQLRVLPFRHFQSLCDEVLSTLCAPLSLVRVAPVTHQELMSYLRLFASFF